MLWLSLYLPRLPIELNAAPHASAEACHAVFEKSGARRWLIACNHAAHSAGLHRGLDVTSALARVPQLKLVARSQHAERKAMQALAAWAGQYSSAVCFDAGRWLLWIEIGASLSYFGGIEALRTRVQRDIDTLGYSALIGIAPTLEAAALLAQQNATRIALNQSALQMALASMPIEALHITEQVADALRGIGWRYVGEVLQLPQDQLARRFGPQLADYLARLTGQRPDLREPYRAPAVYQRHFELGAPVDTIESLLFPLRRLTLELQGYLRSRDTALQTVQLTLQHDKRPSTSVVLHTTTPQRDGARLLTLLREHLERTPLPSPVIALTLSVDQFVALGDTQLDLFNAQSHRDQRWAELLDKLRARLGEQAVKRLGLRDDHRPEHAWCVLQAGEASKAKKQEADAAQEPERPLWLLPATPLDEWPQLLGKPERIEAGWWSGNDTRRDYYIAETGAGARWWLYRDTSAQWFVQGIWA